MDSGVPALKSRLCIGAVLIAALSCTAGCSSVAERLGWRVRLDKLTVTSVSASLLNSRDGSRVSALGPGQSASLVIIATTQDGKQFATVGAGKGKVAFDNYTIAATLVEVSKRGSVSLPSDPRVSEGRTIHLHITPASRPDIAADLDVSVRYDIAFVANFSGSDGANGSDGFNGLDGSAGTDGTPGMTDPVTGTPGTPAPGGNGSDGGNGGDGSNGQDGSPGENVAVWVRLEPHETSLLQIKVVSGSKQLFYLVDPNGGSLKILANGGAGGRGGAGGMGGRGGRGGRGNPSGSDGHDGARGQDGRPGQDGAGGKIVLSVDPAAQQFMKCISWSNHGGSSLRGLPPVINVEPVAALW